MVSAEPDTVHRGTNRARLRDCTVPCQDGDWDQVAELYAERRARLLHICWRRLSSPSDAQDAVQETFVRFMTRSGPAPEKVEAYIEGIAHLVCMSILRRRYQVREKESVRDRVIDPERKSRSGATTSSTSGVD